MNEREKVLVKIKQNQMDRQKLCDEADKLNEELTNLDTTKLRHGDVKGEILFLKIPSWMEPSQVMQQEWYRVTSAGLLANIRANIDKYNTDPNDYNIFDDLMRNNEDSEEFGISGQGKDWFACKDYTETDGYICLQLSDKHGHFTLTQATELYQELGRLIATAKRKAK
jgi:hypothetical protein